MEAPGPNATQYTGDGVEVLKNRVDQVQLQVNGIEQKVLDIEQFYSKNNKKQSNNSKGSSANKDKEKHAPNSKKQKQQLQNAAHMDAAASKRMQELIHQFGSLFRQITQHKWAWPFLEPVDVEGLGLKDYNQIIEKPMDFGTIKKQLEAKDETAYKHVRDIYADVRLVFKNAMKYNDEKNDVHIMAKTLLDKFEDKWLQFLPKVVEEERRREAEEAEAQLREQKANEADHAKLAQDVSNELYEVDSQLEDLRELVLLKCRKMSTEEKRQLGTALTRLSPEDLTKALQIVAQSNPTFQAAVEEVDLDIDALSESTLWRLKFFVKDALQEAQQAQGAPSGSTGGGGNNEKNNNKENAANANVNGVNNPSKRKREICDAIAKTAKKKSKKTG